MCVFQSCIMYAIVPREGVSIECPLNGLFHDLVTIIITSQTVVGEVVDNDNKHNL